MSIVPIQRVLISVSEKNGIVPFALKLQSFGVHILSTGGTARVLRDAGVDVEEVSDFTLSPEILGGRVKTLHPKIFGGILADREKHREEIASHQLSLIDLVVVNLYPFKETLEQIDIGGVSLLRAAAKNFPSVTVLTDPQDYEKILSEIAQLGGTTLETRKYLAQKVFEKTSHYDRVIADYFQGSERLDLHYVKVLSLRYGENPHQKAAFFRDPSNQYPNVTNAKILQGKQLSYNNILDIDAGIKLVSDFETPTAVLIKHTNPCGVACASSIDEAFEKAYLADTISAFGCIIVLNRLCDASIVALCQKYELFVEILVAPSFTLEALNLLKKKKNLRVLETGEFRINPKERDIKSVSGGILVQDADMSRLSASDLTVVTQQKPSEGEIADMLFARTVAKYVKSNAVVFAQGQVTTGIGAGQMSRVDSVFIATHKGGDRVPGSVMASDAFLPFPDAVEEAHRAKIRAIIQPGGSIRDKEIIAKADELGMAMVFTGVRNFKH